MKSRTDYVKAVLRQCGMSWEDLAARAEAIILFGSRATCCYSPDSDVDLLCVGKGRRVSAERLHMVWISSDRVASNDWLRSELGGHVATYGILLCGKTPIGPPRSAGAIAIRQKRMKIRERAEMLHESWDDLSNEFKRSEIRKLRRDVQRLDLLATGDAVPPTPILDKRWMRTRKKRRLLGESLRSHRDLSALVMPLVFRVRIRPKSAHLSCKQA